MKSIIYHPAPSSQGSLNEKVTTRGQCDCDCDCACASLSAPSFFEMPTSTLWRKADDLYSLPLSSEHTLVVSAQNNGLAVLDARAQRLLDRFAEPLPHDRAVPGLENSNEIHHLVAAGLLSAVQEHKAGNRAEVTDSPLVAWLHLTDRCNLRCTYCYLPHVREDMTAETGRAAVDATIRSAVSNGFRQVKLKYAGGEPLLNYPLILELHAYARSLAEEHKLVLEEVVLSNGTLLTNEIASTLRSLDIRLMISVDGYGAYHDSHRPYAGGRGSFKDVAEAVDVALVNGLIPSISVTVSSRTADGLASLMGWILERDLPFSLNFYRENELSASNVDMQLDEQKIIHGMLAAFKVIEDQLPRRPFLGGVIDRANLSSMHTHTCGVGLNYLVFDQHGRVAKCQMQMPKAVTSIQAHDPLAFIRADQLGIQNISVEEKEGCKSCEWKYWCTGGCPLATHRATGRYDVKSPNCHIYKALYPAALRLEGLRLLKYQDDPQVAMQY